MFSNTMMSLDATVLVDMAIHNLPFPLLLQMMSVEALTREGLTADRVRAVLLRPSQWFLCVKARCPGQVMTKGADRSYHETY